MKCLNNVYTEICSKKILPYYIMYKKKYVCSCNVKIKKKDHSHINIGKHYFMRPKYKNKKCGIVKKFK